LNSPFYGWQLKSRAVATIVHGRKIWIEQTEAASV